MTLRSDLPASLPSPAATKNGESSRAGARAGDSSLDQDASSSSGDGRPSTVPGRENGAPSPPAAKDDLPEPERRQRPAKPPLQRSKSDYAPRPADGSDPEEKIREWEARHGFEDHYQSEHIISQLVNVRCAFPPAAVHPLPPDHVLRVSRDLGVGPSTLVARGSEPAVARPPRVRNIGRVVVPPNASPALLQLLHSDSASGSSSMRS